MVPLIDRDELQKALRAHGGRVSAVAEAMGVSRQAIYDAVQRYGLSRRKETKAERRERLRRAAQQPRPSLRKKRDEAAA